MKRPEGSLDHFGQSRVDVNRLSYRVCGKAHSDRVGHLLDQYGGVGSDDVTAQDLSSLRGGQHLYEAVPVIDGGSVSRVVVVVGRCGVRGSQLYRPLLGQTHAGDLRRGEDGMRHGVVVGGYFAVRVEDVMGDVGRLQVGVVFQQVLPHDVAQSPDPGDPRLQVLIHLDEAPLVNLYAGAGDVKQIGVRYEAGRTRISREAQAMGRLGSHPHIVTVFDLGDHEGQPYLVSELMGGGDVEGIIEKAPDHRLPLDQVVDVAVETCRGLEFAHAKGIVHRDLKPGNVWLTADGTTKIGDFGLAVAVDRSRLTQAGMMVGTVSYMPPEQAMGGEVTAQADLYSLGAMLYEMVTGRPPFLGDDSVAIIGQHINTPPVAPTWHNSSCPKPLEALILRLLAKDPAERPESASDVLTALDGVDLSAAVEEPSGASVEANVLDSLAGGVFVGRQREMGELKACLEDALSGRGRLVTLVGEPGIGKTRTAQELATYAGLRGAQVLWGRCYEGQGVPSYWPWVQAIRSYVREREPEQLRSEMGAGAADIAEIVSDVRERLPDLEHPPARRAPSRHASVYSTPSPPS